jgi:hypothetical protein
VICLYIAVVAFIVVLYIQAAATWSWWQRDEMNEYIEIKVLSAVRLVPV